MSKREMTIQEAVEATGLSRITLHDYIKRGQIPARKTGPGTAPWLIPAEVVEKIRRDKATRLRNELEEISEPVQVDSRHAR